MKHKIKSNKKKEKKEKSFMDLFPEEEFTKENFIEGVIYRPAIFLISFLSFIISVFFILIQNYKWAGSFIVFSFTFNIFSLYQSFEDKNSIYRTLNLIFKLTIFIAELVIFNWIIINI